MHKYSIEKNQVYFLPFVHEYMQDRIEIHDRAVVGSPTGKSDKLIQEEHNQTLRHLVRCRDHEHKRKHMKVAPFPAR
jgi:hypothetical protein